MSGASFGDDRGHPDAAATHNRAASRLRGRQRGCGLPTQGPRRGVRLRAGDAGAVRLPGARQAGQGRGAQVPRRRDGHLAQADGAPGAAVAGDRIGPGPSRRQPGPAVRAQVHGGGHPAAGGGRRGLRADVRTGRARGPAAPVRGVRRRGLRGSRRSRTATSTTSGPRRPTAPSAPRGRGRSRRRSPSACARPPIRRAGRATSASTRSTRATATASRAST